MWAKWKYLKRHKNDAVGIRMGEHVSVLEKKLNNFRWNEKIVIFSGPIHLCKSNFWVGLFVRSSGLQGMVQGQKLKILLPEFLSHGVWHTFLETVGPELKKSRERNFGVRPKIFVWMGG
jgi:hypothetical protein